MRADELIKRYPMLDHEENGYYMERGYEYKGEGRAPSGAAIFYVPPGVPTLFHRIDCDEYWCYNEGTPLEVWTIDPEGSLKVELFGTDEGADPLIYFPKGVIFASKHPKEVMEQEDPDGTFFTCITEPRFDYRGFELLEKEQVTAVCPEAAGFWEGLK